MDGVGNSAISMLAVGRGDAVTTSERWRERLHGAPQAVPNGSLENQGKDLRRHCLVDQPVQRAPGAGTQIASGRRPARHLPGRNLHLDERNEQENEHGDRNEKTE